MENNNFKAHFMQNVQINTITSFNSICLYNTLLIDKITVALFFKGLIYNKKNILVFFLILELLTGQKGGILIAKKPSLRRGLRAGLIVGCKVTLRKDRLYSFLETLYISFPRLDGFKGIIFNKANNKEFSFSLKDLYAFHAIEFMSNNIIESIQFTFVYNTNVMAHKKYIFQSFGLPVLIK